jgi:hypothetical protein
VTSELGKGDDRVVLVGDQTAVDGRKAGRPKELLGLVLR